MTSESGVALLLGLLDAPIVSEIGAEVLASVPRNRDVQLSAFLSEVAAEDRLLAHVASYYPGLHLESPKGERT